MPRSSHPTSSKPIYANFASEKITTGAGVAIFHLATERVVVCYHSRDKYWFLPKGRRNVGESTEVAACREGFEESGYRCRLLPLPIPHRQPPSDQDNPDQPNPFVTEPIWTQMLAQSATAQYILFWYAAETIPEAIEDEVNDQERRTITEDTHEARYEKARFYRAPPSFPAGLTLKERCSQDAGASLANPVTFYEPKHHEGTGVDDEEALYRAELLTIDEACRKLRGSIMEDVVRRAWEAVKLRKRMEAEG